MSLFLQDPERKTRTEVYIIIADRMVDSWADQDESELFSVSPSSLSLSLIPNLMGHEYIPFLKNLPYHLNVGLAYYHFPILAERVCVFVTSCVWSSLCDYITPSLSLSCSQAIIVQRSVVPPLYTPSLLPACVCVYVSE